MNRGAFDEENISTEQSQTKENPWLLGEDEYEERPKCLKAETDEGEKKVDGLSFEFEKGER